MPLVLVPILLLLVPIAEIAAFILVGGWIGLWPTLGLVVASAVIGVLLLRRQGLGALRRIQAETAAGRVPAGELLDGVMIVAAGLLLLLPGLLTDLAGYLLFVPAVRRAVRAFLAARVAVRVRTAGRRSPSGAGGRDPGPPRDAEIVELLPGDYERRPDADSPWRGGGNRTLH
jgi:UPF0716 protein FxsA